MADLSLLSPTSSAPPSAALSESLDEQLSQLLSSNSQFSVAAYLNLALSQVSNAADAKAPAPGVDSSLQTRMAELALQLQLQTQSCHEDIGRIGAELQAILPRCAADVGRVGVGLEGMRMDAQALLEQTAMDEEEQELSSSLETLSTLHALQSNLAETKKILMAAATWDSNMNSIPPLLAQQKLTEAVDALAQLEDGERALRGMPHREERKAAISKIRQQVQVLLQPQLQHALQNMSTRLAPLQQCVALYSKLDKMDALRDEYVKNRPGALHKAWFGFSPSYSVDTGEKMMATASTGGNDFATFLPTWYDMVLNLLTEERRQAATIFGAEAAPELIVNVLRECFRPILPSFQSRLETVFSSTVSVNSKGSFESICAAYESTLRFLCLVYELVSGTFLDLAESGMIKKGETGVDLYNDTVAVFVQVASPFTNYQERFDQLEGKNLQVATSLVSKDMQLAVGSVSLEASTALETLQDAIERLKDLAPFVFPMAEGSLDRFELLRGGYRAELALGAVDKILTDHVGEVIIAVKSLSATATSDINKLADSFDEQYALCAMELLKLAGNFHRDMRTFEGKTRDKMTLLSDRIMAHLKLEAEVQKATTSKSRTSASSFSLPDSLTIVEIDSILTYLVCGEDERNDAEEASPTLASLNRLATQRDKGDRGMILYPDTEEAITRLANSCHTFVFDVCSSVPQKQITSMAEMESWREESSANDFDSYGTLPQAYITQVGEHMLALVQAFEPFAADPETLSIANEVMDGVKEVALQPWREFTASAGIATIESTVLLLMHGRELGQLVLNNAALSEEDAELEEGTSDEERASAAFCNAWLDVVGLAVTARLLERIMRIPQLTKKGCEHLSADLNYLINVFSALGVVGHPHPLVSHLADIANLSDDELRDHISARDQEKPADAALRYVEARMALLRGVSIS